MLDDLKKGHAFEIFLQRLIGSTSLYFLYLNVKFIVSSFFCGFVLE